MKRKGDWLDKNWKTVIIIIGVVAVVALILALMNYNSGNVGFGPPFTSDDGKGFLKTCTGGNCESDTAYGTSLCGNYNIDGNLHENGVCQGGGEQCDDGNRVNGDGCNFLCQVENGWACTGQCEDTNDNGFSGPSICNPTQFGG